MYSLTVFYNFKPIPTLLFRIKHTNKKKVALLFVYFNLKLAYYNYLMYICFIYHRLTQWLYFTAYSSKSLINQIALIALTIVTSKT